jgi:Flagellar biosynthesis/type III secretory pathway ATPase
MLQELIRDIKRLEPIRAEGQVSGLEGLRIEATGPKSALRLGALARIGAIDGVRAELVGFKGANGYFPHL